jgi:hypothetical protein
MKFFSLKSIIPLLAVLSLVFLISSISVLAVTGKIKHPESLLLGEWQEVEWTYNKTNHVRSNVNKEVKLNDELKDDLSNGLYIHQSEKWSFTDKASLSLEKKDNPNIKVKWRLKGRGHILKLHYPNQQTEYYQIRTLTDKELVLHFENDVHARGIVEIVLKKIN